METALKKHDKDIVQIDNNIDNTYQFTKLIYTILNQDTEYTCSNHHDIHDNKRVISKNINQHLKNNLYLPDNVKHFIIDKSDKNKQYIHNYIITVNEYTIKLYLVEYKKHLSTKYCTNICKNIANIFNLLIVTVSYLNK